MAVLYTQKQIQDVLKALRILPENDMITTKEAARVLSWRAKAEQGVEREYPEAAIRGHVKRGHLKRYGDNIRSNRYKPEDIFTLPLAPKRGLAQRKPPPLPPPTAE